jgi:hypothetical protein
MNRSPENLAARAAPAIFVLLWSTGFVATKYVLHNAEPLTYSYCVMNFRCPLDAVAAPQHGHRGRVLTSVRIKRARMVAIEFGMWRSGREGGSSGSIIAG